MTTPAEHIANAIAAACDVEHALPYRPPSFAAKSAFVAPAESYMTLSETFGEISIGLDVWILASTVDMLTSQAWIEAQALILIRAAPIDIGGDEVTVSGVSDVGLSSFPDGTTYLVCRISYTRYSIV